MAKVAVSLRARSVEELIHKVDRLLTSYDDRVLAEVRLDYLSRPDEAVQRLAPFASRLIVTYRAPSEGGCDEGYSLDKAVRVLKPFFKENPYLIDIELETLKLKPELKGFDGLIVSKHYFHGQPSLQKMRADITEALKIGRISKVVTKPTSFEEALHVIKMYRQVEAKRLVAFSVGEEWRFTRFLSLALGAPLIYSSLPGQEVAKGQPTLDEALSLLEALRP
jgi:3-dehydroquinate dehydratase-1